MSFDSINRITPAGAVNPHSEPQQLSLLDVPQPVLAGGLADMHPYPLVARTKHPGEPFASCRVPASRAWEWDEIEYARTPTSYTALVTDLDGPGSRDRLLGAVLAKAVQTPSWLVTRESSGGVHAVWALLTPVHRYPHARRAPLDLLARIADYYGQELHGDPGYVGVLAHNPESPVYATEYLGWGWSLEELAQFIPPSWKRPPPRKPQYAHWPQHDALPGAEALRRQGVPHGGQPEDHGPARVRGRPAQRPVPRAPARRRDRRHPGQHPPLDETVGSARPPAQLPQTTGKAGQPPRKGPHPKVGRPDHHERGGPPLGGRKGLPSDLVPPPSHQAAAETAEHPAQERPSLGSPRDLPSDLVPPRSTRPNNAEDGRLSTPNRPTSD